LRFAGFADEEGKYPTRWQEVSKIIGKLLFRWASGSIEKNIINLVPEDKLKEFLTDPEGEKTGSRLRTLATRIASQEKDFDILQAKVGSSLKALIIDAASGTVPDGKSADKNEYQAHAQTWFKSREGGRELAGKLFTIGIWPLLQPQLMPFFNSVRNALDLPEIQSLNP
jgi:putative ATP-dependent endonuclease of OLD family